MRAVYSAMQGAAFIPFYTSKVSKQKVFSLFQIYRK